MFTDLLSIPLWFMLVAVAIATFALVMTVINLRLFREPPPSLPLPEAVRRGSSAIASADALIAPGHTISVCIPARNEESNLEACVSAVLASTLPRDHLRVLVYDDQSTDNTPRILDRLIATDPRVRRVETRSLPAGWVGKQWACQQLGAAADTDWLVFIDADVRLEPNCLPRALAAAFELRADLVSTFPRQLTRSLGESLLVPLIHFILLSYLPFPRMRRSKDPSASAACGQFLFARRSSYLQSGAHAAFKDSMHDGIRMPRAFRRAGFHTDLFDGTALASCRMYSGFSATWRGFAKNAYEGLGSPILLILLTVLHLWGHILPWFISIAFAIDAQFSSAHFAVALTAVIINLIHRLTLARRFQQPVIGALLHPIGVALMTLVQWHSFILALTGKRGWRGRTLSQHSPA
jgi:glycosyltransferase involved in cell wall biosynthesis